MLRVSTRNARFQQFHALLGNRGKRQRNREFLVQGVRPITLAAEYGCREVTGDNYGTLPGYNGLSAVGVADLQIGDQPPRVDEVVRLPEDLLAAVR